MRRSRRLLGLLVGILASVSGSVSAVRAQDPPRGSEFTIPAGGSGPIRRWPALTELSLDYVFFAYTTRQIPNLATTGPPDTSSGAIPGALGQPNTQFLGGDASSSQRPAFLATFTYWLVDPEAANIQATFFGMEDRSSKQAFTSDANGVPVLSRPFFNPNTNAQDAATRALLESRSGSISDSLTTRIMGAEVNLKFYTPSVYAESSGLNLFLGARWLRLQEIYSNFDTENFLDGGGFATTYSDTFNAQNQFWGGQFGGELQYQFLGITFSVMGKLAMGVVRQTVVVSGQTVQTDLTTGAVVTDNREGLYAQPSNVGTYNRNQFAIMPEAGVKAHLDVNSALRIHVGYTVFALTRTVRPTDEIDTTVNVQSLNVDVLAAPALPAPPSFRQQFFRGQMFNLGLELRY